MATNFPNSLDNLTNPASTDPTDAPSHSQQHTNANDAIEALEAKVGINSYANTTSLDYRVSQLEVNPTYTNEMAQDAVAAAFAAGDQSSVSVNYNDLNNTFSLTVNAVEAAAYTSTVKHTVRSAASLTKGQAVYVTGSNGTNMLVNAASNAAEATSSKTFGLLQQDLANNQTGFVITEGLLAGLNTNSAQQGDPVWLGTNGSLIYGLTNKPHAPAHLVFLGIVTRVNT